MKRLPKKLVIWAAAAVAVVVIVLVLPGLYTEARWFAELHQSGVFWRRCGPNG